MIPGPEEYYKCPKCGQISYRGSLVSGNTFGAILYSDGKQISPMLPDFPSINKCKNCDTFYWLTEENEIKEYNFPNEFKQKNNEKVEKAEFLTINEYQEAIDIKFHKNEKEHKHLRINLWWTYNNRFRNNENMEFSEDEYKMFELNCLELKNILNKDHENENIMLAEINRNIGNFSECTSIINTFEEKFSWIKEILEKECIKNNKKVVVIRQ